MASAIGSITRACSRGEGEPLNVLTYSVHERYQIGLSNANATFYLFHGPGLKTWNKNYGVVPANHVLLDSNKGFDQVPPDVEFDLVWSHSRFSHYQYSVELVRRYHLPHLCLDHTLPMPSWSPDYIKQFRALSADVNAFISEYSREKWGWGRDEAEVIHHGVDTDLFSPNPVLVRKRRHALSVCNDWINRDEPCGYSLWREGTDGLPVFVVGDTPGLSKPAQSTAELVMRYREARLFVNTSLVSPIPTALLEAMSCGLPCVTTSTCWIGDVVKDGVNGLIANTPDEIRDRVQLLLHDDDLCERLGKEARRTIIERFPLEKFVRRWDEVFRRTAEIPYGVGR